MDNSHVTLCLAKHTVSWVWWRLLCVGQMTCSFVWEAFHQKFERQRFKLEYPQCARNFNEVKDWEQQQGAWKIKINHQEGDTMGERLQSSAHTSRWTCTPLSGCSALCLSDQTSSFKVRRRDGVWLQAITGHQEQGPRGRWFHSL